VAAVDCGRDLSTGVGGTIHACFRKSRIYDSLKINYLPKTVARCSLFGTIIVLIVVSTTKNTTL